MSQEKLRFWQALEGLEQFRVRPWFRAGATAAPFPSTDRRADSRLGGYMVWAATLELGGLSLTRFVLLLI